VGHLRITYFLAGTLMNQVGQWLEIARFTYWWQVITVYVLYMVPLSVIFRRGDLTLKRTGLAEAVVNP